MREPRWYHWAAFSEAFLFPFLAVAALKIMEANR